MLLTDLSPVLIFVIFLFIVNVILKQCQKPKGLPPGPRLWPVIGNLPVMYGKNMVESFRDLRKKHGDIFCLKLGIRWVIVINGYENLKEALIKNGTMLNDRPDTFFFKLLDYKGILGSSGHTWYNIRIFTQHTLKAFGSGKRSIQDIIKEEVEIMIKTIENKHEEEFILKPIAQAVFSNVMSLIVFNHRYDYEDPQMVKIRKMLEENITDTDFSGPLEAFPILEYLPGDIFHAKRLADVEQRLDAFMQELIEEHKQNFDDQDLRDFTDVFLSEIKKDRTNEVFSERQLVRLCRDLMLAGTDTTVTNVRWVVLHLIHNPEIQEKMFNEIKEVIGLDRLPDITDRPKMTYCDAVCNEALRISNIAPVGVPRSNANEMKLKGYTFPANSVIMPCLDSVLFDENIFPKPEEFIPERFLDGGALNGMTKFNIAFSLGKRKCIGDSIAKMEMFLTIVSLVQKFKLLPPNGSGLPEITRLFGVSFHPAEYKFRVHPRSNE